MAIRNIVLLGEDDAILVLLRSAVPGAEITSVPCLRRAPAIEAIATLIIDPRAIRPCCIERLAGWRERLRPRQVVFLALQAAPEVLLGLPSVIRGTIASCDRLPALLAEPVLTTQSRAAWADRSRLLSPEGRGERTRRFLAVSWSGEHGPPSTAEVAAALCVSVRHLGRLAVKWFGHSPGTIIGLLRVQSVVNDILRTESPLKVIAARHGYRGKNAMADDVRRYTGATPRAHRAGFGTQAVADTRERMSEIRPHSSLPNAV